MAKKVRKTLVGGLQTAIVSGNCDAREKAAAELMARVRASNAGLPKKDADGVLAVLRGARDFKLMQQVADLLIQAGNDSFSVWRQYAQSLLDRGNVSAAIEILQRVGRESKKKDRNEYNEAMGLLGRAYKQLYMDAQDKKGTWVIAALQKSIEHYYKVYRKSPEKLWHGINAAALLHRAKRDEVRMSGYPSARKLACEILETIEQNGQPKEWDLATAAEACIGLGDYDGALQWLQKYIKDKKVTAFHLGSFERQLREVWGMEPEVLPGSRILPLVRRELLRREGATVDVSVEEIDSVAAQRDVNQPKLEKILGRTGVQSYCWWLTALERARGVARIGFDTARGKGTGFLVPAGELSPKLGNGFVLLTNAHVLSDDPNVDAAVRPDEAVITFEALESAQRQHEVGEILFTSPPGKLDVTVIRLQSEIEGAQPYPLSFNMPSAGRTRVYVIGHPQGGTLSFSIQDNLFLARKAPKLHYRAPTEPGSSGSPVFNAQWKLIGLHHAGGDNIRKLQGTGTYAANEGIWIRSIKEAVQVAL